jgi:hypothetical protein
LTSGSTIDNLNPIPWAGIGLAEKFDIYRFIYVFELTRRGLLRNNQWRLFGSFLAQHIGRFGLPLLFLQAV